MSEELFTDAQKRAMSITGNAPFFPEERLNRVRAAAYLGLTESSLSVDSTGGTLGIPFYKTGRKVWYRLSDLDAWLESHRVVPVGAA